MVRGLTTVMGFRAYNGSLGLQDGRPIKGNICRRVLLQTRNQRLDLAGDQGYVRGTSPAPTSVCPIARGEIIILAVLRKQTMRRRFNQQRLKRPLDSLKLVRDEHNISLLLPTVYTTFSLHAEALKGSWERGVFENGLSLLVVQWPSGLRLDIIRIEPFFCATQ